MKRYILLAAALVVIATTAGDASVPNDVETIGTFMEGATPDFTFRFTDAKRCVAGSQAGAVCDNATQCPSSTCIAAPAAATSATYGLTYKTTTVILAPVTITPASSTATVTLPALSIFDRGPGSNTYRLKVAWTTVCAGGANVGVTCTADSGCPTSVCRRGVELRDVRVLNAP